MADVVRTFELGDADVSVPLPDDAGLTELEGLDAGARHLTWAPAPGAHLMLSAGTSPGHTADGLLAGEAERGSGLQVESDAPAPQVAPGARRVAYSVTRHHPRELREHRRRRHRGRAGARRARAQRPAVRPGRNAHLRIGYRVEAEAPAELRARACRDPRPRHVRPPRCMNARSASR